MGIAVLSSSSDHILAAQPGLGSRFTGNACEALRLGHSDRKLLCYEVSSVCMSLLAIPAAYNAALRADAKAAHAEGEIVVAWLCYSLLLKGRSQDRVLRCQGQVFRKRRIQDES